MKFGGAATRRLRPRTTWLEASLGMVQICSGRATTRYRRLSSTTQDSWKSLGGQPARSFPPWSRSSSSGNHWIYDASSSSSSIFSSCTAALATIPSSPSLSPLNHVSLFILFFFAIDIIIIIIVIIVLALIFLIIGRVPLSTGGRARAESCLVVSRSLESTHVDGYAYGTAHNDPCAENGADRGCDRGCSRPRRFRGRGGGDSDGRATIAYSGHRAGALVIRG